MRFMNSEDGKNFLAIVDREDAIPGNIETLQSKLTAAAQYLRANPGAVEVAVIVGTKREAV